MRSILFSALVKNLGILGLGLMLFGVVEKWSVWLTVLIWLVWRSQQLIAEGKQRKMGEEDWQKMSEDVPRMVEETLGIKPEPDGNAFGEWEAARKSLTEHWRTEITQARAKYVPPRPLAVRVAEGIGGWGYLVLLPWVAEMSRQDLISLRRSYDVAAAAFFALCMTLYALPWLRKFRVWPVMIFCLWWVLPTVVLLPLAVHFLRIRHPYLDPMNPERVRLAAEKVVSYPDHIVAADHADWVIKYARELAEIGRKEQAVELCQTALRMNPTLRIGAELLAELQGKPTEEAKIWESEIAAPYVEKDEEIPVAARCEIEDAVVGEPVCTVLLIPMGEVAPQLLDHVAFVLKRETGLETKVYQKTLPLPKATRRRGLLGGEQWAMEPLVETMAAETDGRSVAGPLRLLLVTSADLYAGNANYVFAANLEWGSVVSLARMCGNGDTALERHRAVKLCLGSLIKSFGVAAAADPRCVTSYSASLSEFDAKGNRPIPLTRRLLDEAINKVQQAWLEQARLSK